MRTRLCPSATPIQAAWDRRGPALVDTVDTALLATHVPGDWFAAAVAGLLAPVRAPQ